MANGFTDNPLDRLPKGPSQPSVGSSATLDNPLDRLPKVQAPQPKQEPEGPGLIERAGNFVSEAFSDEGEDDEYGVGTMIGSGVTAFQRGMLDAVLAPGALAGLYYEGLGKVTGQDWLREFGQDLRGASSGKAAIESIGFLMGGGGQKGLSYTEKIDEGLRKQEKLWPTLTAISRTAGTIAPSVLTGGVAGGGIKAGQIAALGAFEGAAGGAQAASEHQAPLRDALTSAVLGAGFGGALGFAGGKVGQLAERGLESARATAKTMPTTREFVGAVGTEAERQVRNIAEGVKDAAVKAAQSTPGRIARAAKKELGDLVDEAVQAKSFEPLRKLSVAQAGGKGRQMVMNEFMRARRSVQKAVADAGDSTAARAAAQKSSTKAAVQDLFKKAGKVDKDWARKTPNDLQKIMHRDAILDRVSKDLSGDFQKAATHAPTRDFTIDAGRLAPLMKDADAPAAINKLSMRIQDSLTDIPTGADAAEIGQILRIAQQKLPQADGPQAMQLGHDVVRKLAKLSQGGGTDSKFAARIASQIEQDLSDEAFGKAGAMYKAFSSVSNPKAFAELSDPIKLRDTLRGVQKLGQISDNVRAHNDALRQAYNAKRALTGQSPPKSVVDGMKGLEKRANMAEQALTIDGRAAGDPLDYMARIPADPATMVASHIIGHKLGAAAVGSVVGGPVGTVAGFVVGHMIAPHIENIVAPFMRIGARHAIRATRAGAAKAATVPLGATKKLAPALSTTSAIGKTANERQEQYKDRLDMLADAAVLPKNEWVAESLTSIRELPDNMIGDVATDFQNKVQTLLQDFPRPEPHIGGPAFEKLSAQALKRSEAMWEATMEPLSVFEDFARGVLDYEKVRYAWKQYPGMKMAAQAALMDALGVQMDDQNRGSLPMSALNKWDYLLDFQGELQKTLKRDFSARFTALGAQEQKRPKPQPSPAVSSKMAEHRATYSERLMGR